MTFHVVALDVESRNVDLATKLRGAARKFAPHISILPRVAGTSLQGRAGPGWGQLLAAVDRLRDEPLELRGPVRIADDLAWYECAVDCRGRGALINLHRLALSTLLRPDAGAHQPNFVGPGYRPHLTVAWRSIGGRAALPRRLRVRVVNLAVYSYQTDPWAGRVTREPIPTTVLAGR